MTYSDNIEKLRQAGVIDMTISMGLFYGTKDKNQRERDINIYKELPCGQDQYTGKPRERHYKRKLFGHQLSYGRACWWIEQRDNTHDNITDSFALSKKRHNKDLPIDDQENREEIAEFLVSLIG